MQRKECCDGIVWREDPLACDPTLALWFPLPCSAEANWPLANAGPLTLVFLASRTSEKVSCYLSITHTVLFDITTKAV